MVGNARLRGTDWVCAAMREEEVGLIGYMATLEEVGLLE